jgi:hypothetical protein
MPPSIFQKTRGRGRAKNGQKMAESLTVYTLQRFLAKMAENLAVYRVDGGMRVRFCHIGGYGNKERSFPANSVASEYR